MLLSSRTPLRVSFFGGGTDYPEYFTHHPGAVVGMAIDRYVYISALKLAEIIDYKYRVSYSKLERTDKPAAIEHPVVRAVLDYYAVDDALDISIQSELPAASGLGSSSAFTVGLVNLVSALRDLSMTRLDLSLAAVRIEREILGENVGVQDQLHASYGGMNRFDFVDGRYRITPVQMTAACQDEFIQSLVLVYTGQTRFASRVLEEQMEATRRGRIETELSQLVALTNDAVEILEGDDPDVLIEEFGELMREGWTLKRRLSSEVSSPHIDSLYERSLAAGAIGGKLCGAGGGGFLLMVVPRSARAKFRSAMSSAHLIPVGMDRQGSVILRS